MEAKELIHYLKPVSLLEHFLSHFPCPLTSGICHSNTSAHSRGEGEGLRQKKMPKTLLAWAGTERSSLSAAVQPDCCPGRFSSPKRSKDNVLLILLTGLSPTLQAVLMGCQSHRLEGPGFALQSLSSNSHCILQGRKTYFLIASHGLFFRSSVFQQASLHNRNTSDF